MGNHQRPAKGISLKNVLFVPNIGTNLFSISAATDLGWRVVFVDTQVLFSTRAGETVMEGDRVGRKLYLLAISPRDVPDDPPEDAAYPSALSPGLSTWHRRLAHANYKTIIKMNSLKAVEGLDLANTEIPSHPCASCSYGKHQRSTFPTGRNRANHTGQLIHSDLCGPMEKPTPNGASYFALFIDDFSGYRFIFLMKNKSEASKCFMQLINTIRGETGNLVRTLRTDGGGEWSGNEFSIWLNKKGIRHETSSPHTPQQDGVSERGIRTVTEGARSCLYDQEEPLDENEVSRKAGRLVRAGRLPTYLWGEAVIYTTYTLNRVICKATTTTPYEAWHNRKPNVSHLKPFGSIAYVHIPKMERKKWDQKSLRCIFVGYATTQKAYRLWEPVSRTVKISRDVTFDEHHRLAKAINDHETETNHLERGGPTAAEPESETNPSRMDDAVDELQTLEESQEDDQPQHQEGDQPRRSLRGRIPKRQWEALMTLDDKSQSVPNHYTDAINSSESDKWKAAMEDEYNSLMENNTWTVMPCPSGKKAIKSRWTFDIKPETNGRPPRYKARFVAKGFSQIPGIDFNETYASVVAHDTLRLFMSTVAAMDMDMIQLDVKTAFLYGHIDEEIYIEQPNGFTIPGRENEVCRLNKCIYGLKQASRVWNEHFSTFLKKQNFCVSKADPCLFIRRKGDETSLLIIWVDDGIFASNKPGCINEFLTTITNTFQIRSHQPDLFVGITITRERNERKLFLSQPDYIDKIVKTFHMEGCHPKPIPADPNSKLVKPPTQGDSGREEQNFPYREAIGSLLYLALVTRPDISFAVGQVARFVEHHDSSHNQAVKRIISYLKGTRTHGILFDGSNPTTVMGYTDADWAGCLDSRRSTTGNIFLSNRGPVAWCSKRQSCTAQSTVEAEYVAASETAKEAIWIKRILPELQLNLEGPIPIYCDNQGTIQLTRNPEQRQKTKHIDLRYHYIREQQDKGQIEIRYVESENQLADILTKALPRPRFESLREALNIVKVP